MNKTRTSWNLIEAAEYRGMDWRSPHDMGQRNRTRRSSMLSVIVATNESERVLVRTLAGLVPGATAGLVRDVILADAGSTDETAEIGDIAGCRFLSLAGPLGPRLAAAAAMARGEWLMFLVAGAELDSGWVAEVTQFIERASEQVAAVFTAGARPHGRASLWRELMSVFRARSSMLKPGRGLLISKSFYRELGSHRDNVESEADLLRRIGTPRIAILRSSLSHRE
jgi:glycosyltransferase involved in cell wall biosynthesis